MKREMPLLPLNKSTEAIGQYALDNGLCRCFGWHRDELEPLGQRGFVICIDPKDPEFPWGVKPSDTARAYWAKRNAH